MRCPKCKCEKSSVTQTRKTDHSTVRFRKCDTCKMIFKSKEVHDQGGLLVTGSIGVVDFDPARIKRAARNVGFTRDVTELVNHVIAECFSETNQVKDVAIVTSMVRYLMPRDHYAALKLLIMKGDPGTVELLRQTAVNLIGK